MAYFLRGWNPRAVYEEDSLTAASGGGGGGVVVPAAHNSLLSIQGGGATERYHLTAAQHQVAIQAATAALNGYLANTDWSTFNGKQAAYAILSTLGALANAAGWLRNDGAGVLSYTTPTAGDVGAAPVSHTHTASQISDSTTIGQAYVTFTNPGAITFPRMNADNTLSALTDSQFRTAIGAGTSSLVLGTTAGTACEGNDSRLSDSRTPTAHQLDGALHTVSGLTAGHFLRALTGTTFGFQAMEAQSVQAVQFNTSPTVTPAQGLTYWDANDLTLATVINATTGVTLQHGKELHCLGLNRTGSTIPNGSLVYQAGTHGNRPLIALADASDIEKCRIIGMVTEDIADNQMGHVTHYGIVRDVNTNGLPDPSILWLSATTPGAWTITPPSSPNFLVLVGCTLNSTTHGQIFIKQQIALASDTSLLSPGDHTVPPSQLAARTAIVNAIAPWWTLAADVHFTSGILSRTDNTLGLSTRTVTITPTVTDFDIYLDAVKFVKTGGASCSTTFSTAIGKHFIYFDAAGTLQNSTTPWVIKDGLAPVAIAWWNGSAARITDERHSAARNVEAHQYLHKTRGTAWEEGLNCTYPTAANDGILQIEAGIIWDEDIEFAIAQQVRCVIWYQTAAGVWTWVNGTNNGGYDRPYLWNAGTSRLQYPDTDLAYALTDAGPANYLVVWCYASTDATPGDPRPIYIVVPAISAPYNTIAQARAETEPDVKTALSPELKLIYKWIYNGSGDYQEGQDFRTVSTLPGGITTTIPHNNTTGIQGGSVGEYYHLTSAQQVMVAAYTTVGAALLSVPNPSAITFLRVNADNSVSTLSAADFLTAIGAAAASHTHTASQISDSTTVGQNFIKLTNPSAVTFLRINADNTVTALSAADFRTALNVVNSGDDITMTVTSGTSTAIKTASYGDLLKLRRLGYSSTYLSVMLGNSSRPVALGIDPFNVTGGQFAGNNTDILLARSSCIRVPTSDGTTNWETIIKFSGGTATAATHVMEFTSTQVNVTQDINLSTGKVVKVNSVQVLAGQGAAVADATDAASAITQLNALLARCRAHGLIAT